MEGIGDCDMSRQSCPICGLVVGRMGKLFVAAVVRLRTAGLQASGRRNQSPATPSGLLWAPGLTSIMPATLRFKSFAIRIA